MSSQRILVTGGAGMIGSNLVKRLVSLGHDVTVVDNLWRGRVENLTGDDGQPVIDLDQQLHRVDLAVPGVADEIIARADMVIHLADVVAGVDYVFQHQGAVFRQNLLINSNVIASVRLARPRGFVYVGTACSFPASKQSGVDSPPLKEEDQYPAAPESAYGWSKLMGEYEALLMEQEVGVPVSVLVLHNVYGSPCDYGERSQVLPALVRKAVRWPKEPFVVFGSGQQGRAFVHVDDVVDALILALEKGLGQGAIQVGTDVCTSIAEAANLVVEVSGKPIPIEYDLSKPEGDRGRRADCSKARQILRWAPSVPLRTGIERLFRWMQPRLA
jgi:nucleoside-diphosphate-sugar epimerase